MISVFPNPSNTGHVMLTYEVDSPGFLEVSIFSTNGSEIEKASTNFSSGINKFLIDTHSLAIGTYICKLSINGKITQEKFIVAH